MDSTRIDELRRRLQKDPASIAFAQLAEEYRRAGRFDEAIELCRTGLAQHPGYLSARVTLGRALLETGDFDEAERELESVVRAAPDNLAAIRGLADIHQRRQDGGALPPQGAGADLAVPPLPAFDLPEFGSADPFAQALESLGALPDDLPMREAEAVPPMPAAPDPALAELEGWLDRIEADRRDRES